MAQVGTGSESIGYPTQTSKELISELHLLIFSIPILVKVHHFHRALPYWPYQRAWLNVHCHASHEGKL
jgi:hypothetical protein